MTLLSWGREALSLRQLGVRVRSDSGVAQFYEKVGFREIKRVPLQRKESADMVSWEEAAIAQSDVSLIHMLLAEPLSVP